MDTLELIDQIEELIEKSRQLFSTAFVNIDDFYNLTNKVRSSLPEDVKSAARITRDADQIVGNAREQGQQIVDQAKADCARIIEDSKAEAARMVESSEIKRLATVQAKDIVASAEEAARATKAGADEYAREVLGDLESFVGRVMTTIQRGREKLDYKSGSGSDSES
jgi:cell division septum initiation protein DivIVA